MSDEDGGSGSDGGDEAPPLSEMGPHDSYKNADGEPKTRSKKENDE